MITDKLLGLFAALARFVVGLFPDLPVPEWLTGAVPEGIRTVTGWASSLGAWIPGEAVAGALSLVGAALAAAVAVKLARIAASFLSAGGGSAG